MVFGITKMIQWFIRDRSGYISINDVLDGYESPQVILPWDKEEDFNRDLRNWQAGGVQLQATMQISVKRVSAIGR